MSLFIDRAPELSTLKSECDKKGAGLIVTMAGGESAKQPLSIENFKVSFLKQKIIPDCPVRYPGYDAWVCENRQYHVAKGYRVNVIPRCRFRFGQVLRRLLMEAECSNPIYYFSNRFKKSAGLFFFKDNAFRSGNFSGGNIGQTAGHFSMSSVR